MGIHCRKIWHFTLLIIYLIKAKFRVQLKQQNTIESFLIDLFISCKDRRPLLQFLVISQSGTLQNFWDYTQSPFIDQAVRIWKKIDTKMDHYTSSDWVILKPYIHQEHTLRRLISLLLPYGMLMECGPQSGRVCVV